VSFHSRHYHDLMSARWPWTETKAEVMQTTAYGHHHIACSILPKANGVFDDPTPLNATDNMLNEHAPPRNYSVFGFLLVGELLPAWLLVRLRDQDTSEGEANKAKILQQFTPFR
jgi:hypothetical protein